MTISFTQAALGKQLISSIKEGNTGRVKKFCCYPTALTYFDDNGQSPLHHAVHSKRIRVIKEIVYAMLKEGISVDIQSGSRDTPIVAGFRNRAEAAIRCLLEAKADPNQDMSPNFFLVHHAAVVGSESAFSDLYEHGADLARITKDSYTALTVARLEGHSGLYKKMKPFHTQSYVYSRTLRHRKLLAHMLQLGGTTTLSHPSVEIEKEVRVSLEGWEYFDVWNLIMKRGAEIFQEMPVIQEALVYASDRQLNTAQRLLERYRSNKPIIVHSGFPRHYVSIVMWDSYFIICNRGRGATKHSSQVLYLHSKKVDADFILSLMNVKNEGQNRYDKCLNRMFSTRHCRPSKIRNLLEILLSFPMQDVGNCTWANAEAAIFALLVLRELIMHLGDRFPKMQEFHKIASSQRRIFNQWQKYMVQAQVTSYIRKPKKETIASPIYREDWKFLQQVAKEAPYAFRKNELASLRLLDAARFGTFREVKAALQKGASLEYVDGNGDSALHHAVRHNRIKVTKYLKGRGASVALLNRNGDSALLVARKKGHKRLYKILKEVDAEVTERIQDVARYQLLREMISFPGGCEQGEIWNAVIKRGEVFLKEFPLILDACRSTSWDIQWDAEKLVARYDKGKKPIIIHSGHIDRYVPIVLWGSYLVVTNCASKEPSCTAYQIDPNTVDASFIAQLKNLQGMSPLEYDHFFKKLQKHSMGRKLNRWMALETSYTTWAKVEKAIHVLFLLQEVIDCPKKKRNIDRQKKNFDTWRKAMISSQLDRYLKHRRASFQDDVFRAQIRIKAPFLGYMLDPYTIAAKDLLAALPDE